jgi:hypothetical protein
MSPRRRDDLVRRVDVSTLPAAESAPKGYYVAVVGTPADGDVPVYDAALGYCVWQSGATAGGSPVTVEDGMGGFLIVFDEDGNVVYA